MNALIHSLDKICTLFAYLYIEIPIERVKFLEYKFLIIRWPIFVSPNPCYTVTETTQGVYSRDGINHVYAELYTAVGVVGAGVRDPAHAVVAVPQQLDPQAVVLVRQLVEPQKEIFIKFIFFINLFCYF